MGTVGYKIFGVVLLAASVSSVIGAAYTSVTFMYSLHDSIRRHNQRMVIGFIACSTLIYSLVGQPVKVLVVAGTLNALVLPLALVRAAGVAQAGNRRRPVSPPDLDAGVRPAGDGGHGGRGGDVVQRPAGILAVLTATYASAISARRAASRAIPRTGRVRR